MEVQVIRSDRKTLSVQITPDGGILVRAPRRLPEREIRKFLEEKADWIRTHREKVLANQQQAADAPISVEELNTLAQQAVEILPGRVRYFAERMGVTCGRITIRNQTTRWGSCSSRGNLNFNCLLMLAPVEVQDYVVVHELAHRKQMNHSAAFWKEVEAVLPDYRKQAAWLKQNGGALIVRMKG